MGGTKHLLVMDASRVVSIGNLEGWNIVGAGICHLTDSPAIYIRGVRQTCGFTEETELVDGVPIYKQLASVIIPKDRPEIMNLFLNFPKKRWLVLAPDMNGYIKLLGTDKEPCQFIINKRGTKNAYDERNETEISFFVTRKDPAYNYTIQFIAVETVGTVPIQSQVFTA